jgi:hypothetical protein
MATRWTSEFLLNSFKVVESISAFLAFIRYAHSIAADQEKNPEFTTTLTTRQSTIVSQQLFTLRTVISHLRNAYNGMDVEWTDQGKNLFVRF